MKLGTLLKFSIPAMLFAAIVFQWEKSYTSASGADPSYTGAPSEGNCTSCHSGTPTSSSSTIVLKKNGSTSSLEYVPDSTYTITIDFDPSGAGRRGFQVTALRALNNTFAGSFTAGTNNQKKTNSINSSTREYITHTSSSNTAKSWSFTWKAPSSNIGDIKFYVAANEANGDGSNSGDKIHLNTFTFKPSSKLPSASITTTVTAVCIGDTIQFNGSGTNSPTSYKWSFSSGHIASSTDQNPKVKTNKTGTLTASLIVYNSYGASLTATKQINVSALPSDTVGITGSTTICDGDSVKLTATPGSKYLWNNGKTSQAIYAKTSDTFNVLVSSAGGCATLSKDVIVNVLEKPTVTFTRTYGKDTLCTGDSLVFEASGTGLSTYTFYNKTVAVQNGANNTYTAKGLANGKHTFYLIATGTNGCKTDTSATYNVFVKNRLNQPFGFCGTSTTGSITINWNAVTQAVGYEVSADTGKTWKTPSGGFTAFTHTETGLPENTSLTMMVRAVDYTACRYGNTGNITCKTLPCSQLTYNLQSDDVICEGGSANVKFSNFSSSKYFITVDGGAATKNTDFSFTPQNDTSITFRLYDSTKLNCAAIEEIVNIKVDKKPELNFRATENEYCDNEPVVVMANAGYAQYTFYLNGVNVKSGADSVYTSNTVKNGDTLYVVGSTSAGCEKRSQNIILTIHKAADAGFTLAANLLQVTFNDTTANVSNRIWDFGDGDTSTAKNPVHIYDSAGTYTVKLSVLTANACLTVITKTITVSTVGLKNVKFADKLSVHPNPVNDMITVTAQLKNPQLITVYITDIKGNRVYEAPATQYPGGKLNLQIPARHFAAGIYMLHMQSGNQIINYKLIKSQER